MKHIDIMELTATNLRSGALKSRLPEFYELQKAVENNAWHRQQSVFDHCVKMVQSLEQILRAIENGQYIDPLSSQILASYLRGLVGQFSRVELLIIASVLHDIAKLETLVLNAEGETSCPGHDFKGSLRVKEFVDRLGLDSWGQQYVEQLIKDHELSFHVMVWGEKQGVALADLVAYLSRVMPLTYVELMIHEDADMRGCDAPPGQLEHYQGLLWSLLEEAGQNL